MYLYRTKLYKPDNRPLAVIPPTNDADLADFEQASKKGQALGVSSVIIQETTFSVTLSYSDFDALVDNTTVFWSNVKYEDRLGFYELYISTINPLI